MSKLRKAIVAIILLLVGGGGSYVAIDNFGAGFVSGGVIDLVGSADNAVSLPNEFVFANSTTTDAGGTSDDGGFVINQHLDTGGIRQVWLNISGVGGTAATSTIEIRQMGSHDGITYFDIATSTAIFTPTSTPSSITPRGTSVAFGLTTSSIALPFTIDGFKHTRFIMAGDIESDDLTQRVQAHISAVMVEDINR